MSPVIRLTINTDLSERLAAYGSEIEAQMPVLYGEMVALRTSTSVDVTRQASVEMTDEWDRIKTELVRMEFVGSLSASA